MLWIPTSRCAIELSDEQRLEQINHHKNEIDRLERMGTTTQLPGELSIPNGRRLLWGNGGPTGADCWGKLDIDAAAISMCQTVTNGVVRMKRISKKLKGKLIHGWEKKLVRRGYMQNGKLHSTNIDCSKLVNKVKKEG